MAVYKSLSKTDNKSKDEKTDNVLKKYKHRVLMMSSRGATYRHRHLMQDLAALMPHARRESKFESKKNLGELNSIAELFNTDCILFQETRSHQDAYLWAAKSPNGPTVKFHVQNIHTMDELSMTGNCLKGSRPLLSFDAAFEEKPHLQVIRSLFEQIFGTPKASTKGVKPFIDRVTAFSIVDGRIWVRNYQISEEEQSKVKATEDSPTSELSLIEIGPRFVLKPILIQEGSFGGPLIFHDRNFVTPRQVRSELRKNKSAKHNARAEQAEERRSRLGELGLRTEGGARPSKSELDNKTLFA